MKTSVERIDDVTVRLSVEVESSRVTKLFDQAARGLGSQLQVPGFRKGKVPRRILEARVGHDAIRQQAMQEGLSELYVEAMKSEDLQPVSEPELDLEVFDEKEGCRFEATVEVRPEFDLPDPDGIEVTFPEWDVSDDDVEEQLEETRDRFSELAEVDRPVRPGDYVTLDLDVILDGEPLEDAAVEDALYEVGSEGVTPKLDGELVDCVAGSEFTYTDVLPEGYPEHGGEEADFRVAVKDVREKHLPELDDDFAITASEFDTIAELRKDIRDSLLRRRVEQGQNELRSRVVEAYLARVDMPLPPSMVDGEREARLEGVERQAQQFGMELEELLEAQGRSHDELESDADRHARSTVKAQIVLDALARELDVTVTSADLEQEIIRHARSQNVDPRQLAEAIRDQGHINVMVGDVMRRKAIDHIMERAVIEGGPSDEVLVELGLREPPEGQQPDDDGADEPAAGQRPSGLIVPGEEQAQQRSSGGLYVPGQD